MSHRKPIFDSLFVEDFPEGSFPPDWSDELKIKEWIWLKTFYIMIPTDNILSLIPGEVLCSDIVKIRGLPESYMFQVMRCPGKDRMRLAASICRYRLSADQQAPADNGSFVLCGFSMVGFSDQASIPAVLVHGQDSASAFFSFWSAMNKMDELNTQRYVFELKAVILLVEYGPLPGEVRDRQEEALRQFRETLNEEEVYALGELVGCSGLVNVFLGRSNSLAANIKLIIIKRTLRHATRLIEYLDIANFERENPDYPDDIPFIINYLVTGGDGPVRQEDVLVIYLLCQKIWLPHLSVLIKDHIIAHLNCNINVLMQALQLSCHVEDLDLFEKVAVKYLARKQEAQNSISYKTIKEQTPWVLRAIIHAVTHFMSTKKVWIQGWKEGERSAPPERRPRPQAHPRPGASRDL